MLVVRTPIQSTSRHELARVDPIDLELPWQTLVEVLKDKDFVSLVVTTKSDSYVITKDSSW